MAPCTRDFFRALSLLQVIARNCDWFIALSTPFVIGRSNCFGFGFSTVTWKPLYQLLFSYLCSHLHYFFCYMDCCFSVHCQGSTFEGRVPLSQRHKDDQLMIKNNCFNTKLQSEPLFFYPIKERKALLVTTWVVHITARFICTEINYDKTRFFHLFAIILFMQYILKKQTFAELQSGIWGA